MSDLGIQPQPVTIYVAIGNSDDRLSQKMWARYYERIDDAITGTVGRHDGALHGRWVSHSTDSYQNACWAFGEPEGTLWHGEGGVREHLREWLQEIAAEYGQESVAWTEGQPEFLLGVGR